MVAIAAAVGVLAVISFVTIVVVSFVNYDGSLWVVGDKRANSNQDL